MGPSPPSKKHAHKTCTCRHAHGFLHMVCACVTSPITHANKKNINKQVIHTLLNDENIAYIWINNPYPQHFPFQFP